MIRKKRETDKLIRVSEILFLHYEYVKRKCRSDDDFGFITSNIHTFEHYKSLCLQKELIWENQDVGAEGDSFIVNTSEIPNDEDNEICILKLVIRCENKKNILYAAGLENEKTIDIDAINKVALFSSRYNYSISSLLRNVDVFDVAMHQYAYHYHNFLHTKEPDTVNKTLVGYEKTKPWLSGEMYVSEHLPTPGSMLNPIFPITSEKLPARQGGMTSRLVGLYLWDERQERPSASIKSLFDELKEKIANSTGDYPKLLSIFLISSDRAESVFENASKCIQAEEIFPLSE